MKKWFQRSLLFIGSSVLAVFIVEGILRVYLPQPLIAPIREIVGGMTVLVPNVQVRISSPSEYDTIATINSQRFRSGKEYSIDTAGGRFRIVTLGDSFTFGTGVNDDETYPVLLGRLLRVHRPNRLYEVINAGIHGTGIGEQVLWYDTVVREYHPSRW